ncbi:MAG TPA: selenide, water dikinase SelD [Dehalococcoidia bacterium]|nr:selenide, water dikinase SelD [Dehalococcoidia bacterium]
MESLTQVLRPLQKLFSGAGDPNVIVGFEKSDDAAVYRISDEVALIETLDFFPPVVDDAWTYGAIAAANAMSDVYAMGGEVKLALNIVAWPEHLDNKILSEVLRGAGEKVLEAGGTVVGGHTIVSSEPKFGLSVTGIASPERLIKNSGATPGDVLCLTKPIGTGISLTAAKQSQSHLDLSIVIDSMLQLNKVPSQLALLHNATAMTDITGFGLIGHSVEMANASGCTFEIYSDAVPLFANTLELLSGGAESSGLSNNKASLEKTIDVKSTISELLLTAFFDPQTSGPLLVALPKSEVELFSEAMENSDHKTWIIGQVLERTENPLIIS